MRIAVIGWGSLIWDPRSLKLASKWRHGGPRLRVEYSRISSGHRITLVIHKRVPLQPTQWVISALNTLQEVRIDLQQREGVHFSTSICTFSRNGQCEGEVPILVRNAMKNWLAQHPSIDAAIWTGLASNWSQKRDKRFSRKDAMRYLKKLCDTQQQAAAQEYVQRTPRNVRTPLRLVIEKQLGWYFKPTKRRRSIQ
jgi:hypothetical protein